MKNFTSVIKALSDPNRVTICKVLEDRVLCVCELQSLLGLAQPTVSKHMRILEDAGLVERRKDKLWVNFRLQDAPENPTVAAMLQVLRSSLNEDPTVREAREWSTSLNRETLCTTANPAEKAASHARRTAMEKQRILFICVHNSARSQMAEEYLKMYGEDRFDVFSAGLEPGEINPLAAEVMKEEGVDISGKQTQSVFELYKNGRLFDHVITVCDEEAEKKCPIFPGVTSREHWGFADPAQVEGTHEQKLNKVRDIREEIKHRIRRWVSKH